mmetsp:Transcript_17921/g.29662  ORF Transcript_17921/g.29662 Transcript_17921/m.29662 type:complete len:250 (+) Transcript_17921:258-1007(+)
MRMATASKQQSPQGKGRDTSHNLKWRVICILFNWIVAIPFMFVPIDTVFFFIFRGGCIGFVMGALQMIMLKKLTTFDYSHRCAMQLPFAHMMIVPMGLWCCYAIVHKLDYLAYILSYASSLGLNIVMMLLLDYRSTILQIRVIILLAVFMFVLGVGMAYAVVFGLFFASIETWFEKAIACIIYPIIWELIKSCYLLTLWLFLDEGKLHNTMGFLFDFCAVSVAALPYRAIFIEFESWGDFLAIFIVEIL